MQGWTQQTVALVKQYWHNVGLESQINKAVESSLKKRINKKAIVQHLCIARELTETTDLLKWLYGSGYGH